MPSNAESSRPIELIVVYGGRSYSLSNRYKGIASGGAVDPLKINRLEFAILTGYGVGPLDEIASIKQFACPKVVASFHHLEIVAIAIGLPCGICLLIAVVMPAAADLPVVGTFAC